ncbi:thioredoxin fold domain-containing protein [Flavobacteriaceae bacterium]|nr:thioredoxin fold domain-containing protein [Flavobacteriaceae bacterium]MDB4773625.1 thioredoxin fold domain-containing protein [Flavobacteriaceae bacterium]
MKIKLLVLFILSFVSTYAQQIEWMSLAEALEAQKKEPKKIFMDVYTTWCGPCKLLDKKTFANKDLARYVSEHFYAVKFNAEGDELIRFYNQNFKNPNYDQRKKGRNATHQFTQFLGIKGYPTMVFFSEDGDPIMPVVGYYTAQELEPYLKMIKQGDYMVFQGPDALKKYLKSYVPRFRGK